MYRSSGQVGLLIYDEFLTEGNLASFWIAIGQSIIIVYS